MLDNTYWKNIIASLGDKDKANWAAHVLSTNIDQINELVQVVDKETFIKNCLICYSIDFSAQPYLDQLLTNFSIEELIQAYKKLEKKPIQTAGALMWLLEDIDPDFKWVKN
jgi:hypothetical protein